VIVRSVVLSVILSVSRIIHERGDGRRPNMVGMTIPKWLIFGADPVPDVDRRLAVHFL